eukprot:4530735-Amphidinium_carterae.1
MQAATTYGKGSNSLLLTRASLLCQPSELVRSSTNFTIESRTNLAQIATSCRNAASPTPPWG